jgi:hypothetical protein
MRTYSIVDLLIGQYYHPASFIRRNNGGIINFAEKRDDVYLEQGFEPYAIRYNGDNWATVAVRVAD